jgi:hypothetical protein
MTVVLLAVYCAGCKPTASEVGINEGGSEVRGGLEGTVTPVPRSGCNPTLQKSFKSHHSNIPIFQHSSEVAGKPEPPKVWLIDMNPVFTCAAIHSAVRVFTGEADEIAVQSFCGFCVKILAYMEERP